MRRPSLVELQQPCQRPGCGHQNAVHTVGADDGGWAIFEPTWANAAGACAHPGCECPARLAAAVRGAA